MDTKFRLQSYYHFLYRSLKFIEEEMHQNPDAQMLHLLEKDIDKLSVFLSMLAYLDNSLPLLRAQGALSKMKKDISLLVDTFKQESLLIHEEEMMNEEPQVSGDLSIESEARTMAFMKSSHQLYINTIHATEKIIDRHINELPVPSMGEKIKQYFRTLVGSIVENRDEILSENIDAYRDNLKELYYNFELFGKTTADRNRSTYDTVHDSLKEMKKNIDLIHLYQSALQKLDSLNIEGKVKDDLSHKYNQAYAKAENFLQTMDDLDDQIVFHLNLVFEDEYFQPDQASYSLQARNIHDQMT